eukprot:SAG31_NODE_3079_length_4706_cov_3.887779_3_plen_68_part_00
MGVISPRGSLILFATNCPCTASRGTAHQVSLACFSPRLELNSNNSLSPSQAKAYRRMHKQNTIPNRQ